MSSCSQWKLLLVLAIGFAPGCVCIQGLPGNCAPGTFAIADSCGGDCLSTSGCPTGQCGSALGSFAACQGACGEVYVDEWISTPPEVDNCGYECGGCNSCRNFTPVRSLLKLLCGRPYYNGCSLPSMCGPSCDSGCATSSVMPGDCNCGATSHVISGSPVPAPMPVGSSSQPMPTVVTPQAEEVVPTPAPSVSPTSARLNPARRHQSVRTAGGF